MKVVLSPHHSCQNFPAKVSHTLKWKDARTLSWQAEVISEAPEVVGQTYGMDYRKNWELWNFDVCEVFLQLRQHPQEIAAPYIELQISRLGQPLAIVIQKPRVSCYIPLGLELKLTTERTLKGWRHHCELLWPGEVTGELYFGAFACLGEGAARGYFSHAPNLEANADFHRPEFFIPWQATRASRA